MDINLSANTLFHYTTNAKSLQSILRHGLYVRYSLENFENLIHEQTEIVLPMVCFCDIPLSQVKRHTITYGKYAIGLSKKWGMNNKINPVIYAYPNSTTSEILNDIGKDIQSFFDIDESKVPQWSSAAKLNDKTGEYDWAEEITNTELLDYFKVIVELQDKLGHFLKYIKPYEGKFFRDDNYLPKPVRFYEEREWRYTPPRKFFENINVKDSYSAENYVNPIKRRAINIKLAKHIKLPFTANDIRFIIVSKDDEIPEMLAELEKIFGSNTPYNELKLLGTRLISLEQILEDL